MNNVSSNSTIAERIRDLFSNLTRSERQLSEVIMKNYPASGLGSITTIAEAANVSTPTVARMARKLGFSGFPELQATLRHEVEATLSCPVSKRDRWAQNAPDTHILNRFAAQVTDNLHQSLRQIDTETFNNVVSLLTDPDRQIYLVGGRITQTMAAYFTRYLQVTRSHVTLLDPNVNIWPHYILNMKQGDVLICFDIRRYEVDTNSLCKMVKAHGIKVVLFTDQWSSPIAKYADYSFHCRIEAPSAWDSMVVMTFMVESFISAIETEMWEKTSSRMKKLEELYGETQLFRKNM